MGDREEERASFHIDEEQRRPMGPGRDAPLESSFDPARIDFGHYAGHTVEELAEVDPDYLRWLERHPSGMRYRAEISRVLGMVRLSTDWTRGQS